MKPRPDDPPTSPCLVQHEVFGDGPGDSELNLVEEIRRLFAPFGGVELEPHPPTPVRPPPELPDDWKEDA
jgi:hypothetical protein